MKTFAILGAALAFATLTIDTADARGGRFVRENPAGGVTAGAAFDRTGPEGGRRAGARGERQDQPQRSQPQARARSDGA